MIQVGAETIVAAVLSSSALNVGKERRAHFADQGLGGVDQGQTLLNVFITQAITKDNKNNKQISNDKLKIFIF